MAVLFSWPLAPRRESLAGVPECPDRNVSPGCNLPLRCSAATRRCHVSSARRPASSPPSSGCRSIARHSATVVISGETGTGKELISRAVHYLGPRAPHPFVPVNCGALPDALLEDELFGHERGAFTDAKARRAGLLSQAEHGTVFLDEVDSLTPRAQVALLRVLQGGTYRSLGGDLERPLDVRFVAATNTSLSALVRAGRFRSDLYYRLCVLAIHLPPLRDRREDILLLARHFLTKYQDGPVPVQLAADAERALLAYSWPGNVRELENVIQRSLAMTAAPVIVAADLGLAPPAPDPSALLPASVLFAEPDAADVTSVPPAPARRRRGCAGASVQRGEARGARRVRARLPSAGVARASRQRVTRGSIRAQRAPRLRPSAQETSARSALVLTRRPAATSPHFRGLRAQCISPPVAHSRDHVAFPCWHSPCSSAGPGRKRGPGRSRRAMRRTPRVPARAPECDGYPHGHRGLVASASSRAGRSRAGGGGAANARGTRAGRADWGREPPVVQASKARHGLSPSGRTCL